MVHTCRSIETRRSKGAVSVKITSRCIYRFACYYGTAYIGRTMRIPYHYVKVHYLTWLRYRLPKTDSSSILAHLVDTAHRLDFSAAFKVLRRAPGRNSSGQWFIERCATELVTLSVFSSNYVSEETYYPSISYNLAQISRDLEWASHAFAIDKW